MDYNLKNDKTVKKYKLKSNLILIWDKFIKIVPAPFLIFIVFYIIAGLTGHLVNEDGTVVSVSNVGGAVISLLLFALPVYHICRFIYWRTDRGLESKIKHQQKSIKRIEKAAMYTQMSLDYMDNTVISKKIEDGNPTLVTAFTGESTENKNFDVSNIDELLFKSIEIVIEAGQASTSLLQRHLKTGYAHAARIMDAMESIGIIGPYEGSKPRTVLITHNQWEEIKGLLNGNLLQSSVDIMADNETSYSYNESIEKTFEEKKITEIMHKILSDDNNFSPAPKSTLKYDMLNPSFDYMTGDEFEHFCAELLKENKFTNVRVTQASGDYGIDILAEKDYVTYAIQCKCYSSNIGNHAVQEAFSGKEMYKRMVGVVMTNQYFTPAAKKTAEDTRILLWDRDVLIKMIGTANLNIKSAELSK